MLTVPTQRSVPFVGLAAVVTLLSSGLTGCRVAGDSATVAAGMAAAEDLQRGAAHAPVSAADSSSVRDAEAAFTAWLDRSLERADAMPSLPDGVCDDGGGSFPSPLLASYAVMPSQMRGDTIVARASVTTVAEQDIDRRVQNRFTARQRVRTDVLEWDVIPSDTGWLVCNGIRFGYRGADSLTTWSPQGADLGTARVLADSVRRAQGAS